MNAIEIEGLTKSYGSTEAVRGVDLQVRRGEVFSLLGPNGAGKTTTVEICEGHRRPTSGKVSVLGFDPTKNERAFKERIGIVLQETGVERFLTVAEVIDRFRGFYPNPRPRDEIIELVGLVEQRDKLVRKLSGGQQRRLDVAIGLAGSPDLLFLDEPTTGFDPSARRGAWEMIRNLRSLGVTVLLTTHYMDEAQSLADRVAIIARGRIVAEGTPAELSARAGDVGATVSAVAPRDRTGLPEGAALDGDRIVYRTQEPVKLLNDLTGWALERGEALEGLTVAKPTLEDVYLQLTAIEDDAE